MKFSLFITGFIQVFLVVANTYFVSNVFYLGVLVMGFAISFIWSFNVKRVVLGTMQDRIIYSLGAALGSVVGLWASSLFLSKA